MWNGKTNNQTNKKQAKKEEENEQGHLTWKEPGKDRVGDRLEKNYKGCCEIPEEDSQEKVADEITFRLQEPKEDLIARVVSIIRNKKATSDGNCWSWTTSGLFIMNGSKSMPLAGPDPIEWLCRSHVSQLSRMAVEEEQQVEFSWISWKALLVWVRNKLRKAIFNIENWKEYEN